MRMSSRVVALGGRLPTAHNYNWNATSHENDTGSRCTGYNNGRLPICTKLLTKVRAARQVRRATLQIVQHLAPLIG